jgi:glycogen debranching enzyme
MASKGTGDGGYDSHGRLLTHGSSTLLADLGDALTTKSGGIFCLCAGNGDIDAEETPGHGLYFHDTRFVDRAVLRLGNEELAVLLSSAYEDDRSVCELTNPNLTLSRDTTLPKERIGIRRERRLGDRVVETIELRNFSQKNVSLPLELEFGSSFDSMFVVRGAQPGKRGLLHRPRWYQDQLVLRYDGADGRTRTATLRFDPPPSRTAGGRASYRITLAPSQRSTIRIVTALRDDGPGALETRPRRSIKARFAFSDVQIACDNQLFQRVVDRSFQDLRMLVTRERGETYFAAGVPWFVCLFGRDSIVTALETLAFDPVVARETLLLLARYQGRKHDEWRDEEPGKILHELRIGEEANLGEIPQTPYYGTVDATPLFICLLAQYVRWTGDLGLFHKLRRNVERALQWLEEMADHDSDGFVDYISRSRRGLANQGWKDSGNAIANEDGTPVEPPVALVEVQGYAYRARLDAAWLFRLTGDRERAEALERSAEELRTRFHKHFWVARRRYLALALQRGGRPATTIASNPGQALWSGIVDARHAAAVARMLMSERMFSGWGVRTMAEGEAAFNPVDYQVGSVWPHDNALIAAGLKRYGFVEETLRIFSGLYDAATRFPSYRLPEVFAGFRRDDYPEPVRYPVACAPQAWSAAALPYMLQVALGLEPDATGEQLRVVRPALPEWIGELTLRNVQVGEASVDLRFRRQREATAVAVLGRQGSLSLTVEV